MNDTYVAVLAWMVGIVMFVAGSLVTAMFLQEEPGESYQAALNLNNWTNRTLDIDIYVFGSESVLFSVTDLEHEENVTVIVTWQDVEGTIAFLHCMGNNIDEWCVYELDPGQWRSVVLW